MSEAVAFKIIFYFALIIYGASALLLLGQFRMKIFIKVLRVKKRLHIIKG